MQTFLGKKIKTVKRNGPVHVKEIVKDLRKAKYNHAYEITKDIPAEGASAGDK
jgi:hypothetical protein